MINLNNKINPWEKVAKKNSCIQLHHTNNLKEQARKAMFLIGYFNMLAESFIRINSND